MQTRNNRKAISQELYLLDNHTMGSRIITPIDSQARSLVNSDRFSNIRRKTAIDQALMISRLRNRIEVVKRCVQAMKKATYFKDLSLLTHHQKSLIDDKATDLYIDQSQQGRIPTKTPIKKQVLNVGKDDRFRKLVFYLIEHRVRKSLQLETIKQKFTEFINFSFQPTNLFVVLWNMIMVMVILHNFFTMPLQDAFNQDFLIIECVYMQLLIQLEFGLLILDIAMQFNVAIMNQGDLIHDKKLIVQQYLRNGFIFDMIGLFGFIFSRYDVLFVQSCSNSQDQLWVQVILKYFFFFKQHRFTKLLSFFKHQLYQSKKVKNYLQLVELLILVLIMAHYIACLWIIIGHLSLEIYPNSSWMSASTQLPDVDIYLKAMYFACMTMTTVGYGDILPRNRYEYLACIAIMLISCGFFAYILNTITLILGDIKSRKKLYVQELEVLENYMLKTKIDRSLQNRVTNYLKCMHEAGLNDDKLKESAVLNKLNSTLQSQLLFQDKGKIFQNVPCIRDNFTKDFTVQIIDRIKEIRISPGETININELVQDDHKSQGRFIFVVKGTIEFSFQKQTRMNNQSQMKIFKLQEGEYYGLPFLFGEDQDQAHKFTLRSTDFSVLYTLTSDDIILSLDQKAENKDKQRYCMIRDKVRMNQDYSYLKLKCQLCGHCDHEINKCSFFFMQPDKKAVISKNQYSRPQQRQYFQRNQSRTQSRTQFKRIQLQALQFNDEDDDQSIDDDQYDQQKSFYGTEYQKQQVTNNNLTLQEEYPHFEDQILEEDSDYSIQSWTAEDPDNIPINDVKGSLEKKPIQDSNSRRFFQQKQKKKKVSLKTPEVAQSFQFIDSPAGSDPYADISTKPIIKLQKVIRKIALIVPWITHKRPKSKTNTPSTPKTPITPNTPKNTPMTTIREARSGQDTFGTRMGGLKHDPPKIFNETMDQFETAFQFEVYFVHNNLNKVLQKLNKRRYFTSKKNQSSQKSAKRKPIQQQQFQKLSKPKFQ